MDRSGQTHLMMRKMMIRVMGMTNTLVDEEDNGDNESDKEE